MSRLIGLLGKRRLKGDEGLWLCPSQGIHTIGVLFPIDVVYVDGSNRVIHLIENFGTFRIAAVRLECRSVLELPPRTIFTSQTQVGDELVICPPARMEVLWNQKERVGETKPVAVASAAKRAGTTVGRLTAWIGGGGERREFRRIAAPIVAFCWAATGPSCPVRNVTPAGAYIVTRERWYLGTIVTMAFQYESRRSDGRGPTAIQMRAKVLRYGPDGVGVRFVYLGKQERLMWERFLAGAGLRSTA